MIEPSLVTLIMAAGKGTRMKSDLAKVLHPIQNRPMIHFVIELARNLDSQRIIAIIGHQKEKVREALNDEQIEFVIQEPQLGTGHAVMQAEPLLKHYEGDILVLSGDVPVLSPKTMKQLIRLHRDEKAEATVLTAVMPDPTGYGRVIRAQNGQVIKIVEHKDATEEEKKIREINSGIYVFHSKELFSALKKINPNNAQQEYYLPDVLKVLIHENKKVSALMTPDYQEISGINTPEQLQHAEEILTQRFNRRNADHV